MKKFSLLFVVLFAGCTSHIADYAAITTRDIELEHLDIDSLPKTENVVGRSYKFYVLLPVHKARLDDAVEDALNKGNGDLLIDASVYYTGRWLIFGETELEIYGTVVDTRKAVK